MLLSILKPNIYYPSFSSLDQQISFAVNGFYSITIGRSNIAAGRRRKEDGEWRDELRKLLKVFEFS